MASGAHHAIDQSMLSVNTDEQAGTDSGTLKASDSSVLLSSLAQQAWTSYMQLKSMPQESPRMYFSSTTRMNIPCLSTL